MKIQTTLLALVATTTLLTPAMAQPAGPDNSQIVSYADLDLSRSGGVRELDRRLRVAIEQACGPISSADPAGKRAVRRCRTELGQAVAARRAEVLAGAARPEPIQVAFRR